MLLPLPGGGEDRTDIGMARLPAEDSARGGVAGVESCRIPGTSLRQFHGAGLAAYLFGGANQLQHTRAAARAEIDAPGVVIQLLQREAMRLSQILHVDVVADAGIVRRVVVGAEHADAVPLAGDGLQRQRDQMCLRVVRLTDAAVLSGSGGVEVTQGDVLQTVGAFVV